MRRPAPEALRFSKSSELNRKGANTFLRALKNSLGAHYII